MSILSWLSAKLGKARVLPESKGVDSEPSKNCGMPEPMNGLSIAELELLKRYEIARSREVSDPNGAWARLAGTKPSKVLASLQKRGLLVEPNVPDFLTSNFGAEALKSMARERGVKVSGTKAVLASRLTQAAPEEMASLMKQADFLVCSAEGQSLAKAYRAYRERQRVAMKQEVVVTLKDGDYRLAAQIVCQYEAVQPFPRGIGISWSGDGMANHLATEVATIMATSPGRPAILAKVPPERFAVLQEVAAMAALFGTNTTRRDFPEDFDTGMHLAPDVAARMLIFHASAQRDLENFRRAGFKFVKTMPAPDSCPHCVALSKKRFPLAKAPDLPHPGCTHEMGCRCCYTLDDKELRV